MTKLKLYALLKELGITDLIYACLDEDDQVSPTLYIYHVVNGWGLEASLDLDGSNEFNHKCDKSSLAIKEEFQRDEHRFNIRILTPLNEELLDRIP